jgi:bifunctional oligoribonuclease and PAP phosphatase NrnA
MSLEPIEQFEQFLEKSKDVLILIPENSSGDAVGSAWALYFFLQKKNIEATIATSGVIPEKYSFLPRPEKILNEISGARDFVLSFNTTFNKIVNLRSEKTEDKFNIYLTPEKGAVDPRDFSFILAKFKYDLLIVLDASDLERLGKIYEANPDLFFEVPIVNIDHKSNNENFGQINLTNVTASSSSEILAGILQKIDAPNIDKIIAECLLTGIMSSTESFQRKNTTPKTLLTAATLMDQGADQQAIVRWLYKTHPLHILKLWGRSMAKLNWDNVTKLAWTTLSVEDFIQSRSKPDDLSLILEKLQENYNEGKFFAAIYNDTPETSIALIKGVSQENLIQLNQLLQGTLDQDYLKINIALSNLEEAGKALNEKVKELALF